MFNFSGSELAFLVLIGLIILGPEKLPDAVRKFSKLYAEFRKVATGFQGEMKQAFQEPIRELRETTDAVKKAAELDLDGELSSKVKPTSAAETGTGAEGEATAEPQPKRKSGLNFGADNPQRRKRSEE